ncbi:alpha/beta hydrolase family protein [Paenibacillus riograndensis]|uniref:Platelet-activating factor acetylhydrolase, plasma/intracellular isoform II n=1 Tax=Paenibacillus riograndensis SBR5 TaxID=1073571 RepID=A0A0E4H7N2_9BACL|nr:dienelactone hydrolase family protein [Paenibacillus riograndensis]CQR52454.1 platelet-activating factor acetylhydrolase, plasma/intracellular isoform II [Paenibacillus riograndensis SBR5]
MEILILVVTLVFELAIAVYSIVTKQSRNKIKSWARITMFVGFMMLILGKVVVWEYTWGLFAGLLFILAFKEMIALLRKQTHTPRYKAFSAVWKSLFLSLTVVVTLVPVLLFPQHRLPQVTGPYPVATATYTYTDKNRIEEFTDQDDKRFVNVEFWYPEQADGTYPLLVFSHGAFGIKTSNTSTFTELASHGYVVVSIDHPYHSFYTVSEDGKVVTVNPGYLQDFSNANIKGVYPLGKFFELNQKWMKLRTDDMDFVMDTILEQAEQKKDSVYERINTQKIGVFGHSMGGSASVALSRKRDDIDAVVNIDAPFYSELVYDKVTNELTAKSEAYTIPLLNVYSDDVWIQLDSNSSYLPYIANRISNINFKGAYNVHFKGAKHLSLTDLPLFSPILANLLQGGKADIDTYYAIETQNELILRFFDYALKNKGQFAPKATY